MRKLGRYTEHRLSMLQNLCISIVEHGKIVTTLARAKELKRIIDPFITRAKIENLHNRRILLSRLKQKDTVNKLFKIAQENTNRPGGYTQIVRCGYRSDGGEKALIKIIDYPVEVINDRTNL